MVDDSRAMRLLMVHVLRSLGYAPDGILEAADGPAALELARAQRPAIVLSDLYMPGMDGLELWAHLRELGDDTPRFGLVTCAADKPTRQLAEDAGVHFMLTKPVQDERLRDALQLAFAQRRRALNTGRVHVAVPEDASVFSIRLLVQKLFRSRTAVDPARRELHPDDLERPIIARYTLPDSESAGYALMELATAARMAGALTLLPLAVLREELAQPKPDSMLESNLHELFSILSQLFNRGGRVRARLDRLYRGDDLPPPELRAVARDPSWRADATVSIAGYGGGEITILGAGGRKIPRRDPISRGPLRRPDPGPTRSDAAPTTGELLSRRRR